MINSHSHSNGFVLWTSHSILLGFVTSLVTARLDYDNALLHSSSPVKWIRYMQNRTYWRAGLLCVKTSQSLRNVKTIKIQIRGDQVYGNAGLYPCLPGVSTQWLYSIIGITLSWQELVNSATGTDSVVGKRFFHQCTYNLEFAVNMLTDYVGNQTVSDSPPRATNVLLIQLRLEFYDIKLY